MIEYIRGRLAELEPTQAVVEAAGVGYLLNISLGTYTALRSKGVGGEVLAYVSEVLREDAHLLFGFATRTERTLFTHLTSVSGVGGGTARTVLSAFSPAELASIIASEDVRALRSVKGIGPKAAQRIIVDLKDKTDVLCATAAEGGAAGPAASAAVHSPLVDEAVAALTTLGFPPAQAMKAAREAAGAGEALAVDQIIKGALALLRGC